MAYRSVVRAGGLWAVVAANLFAVRKADECAHTRAARVESMAEEEVSLSICAPGRDIDLGAWNSACGELKGDGGRQVERPVARSGRGEDAGRSGVFGRKSIIHDPVYLIRL